MAEVKKKFALSASSIKTFETCSWLFFCQYVLKLPQKNNEGAMRGTTVHTIFECLLRPKHLKHFNAITKAGTIVASPGVDRLVKKTLKEFGILNTTNYKMCDEMILVGLRNDFFGKKSGGKVAAPEYRFELESAEPEYRIRGFIDKMISFPDGAMKIVDYKSSKKKFKDDELSANVQALAYSLVGYKMLGAKDVTANFIFLRYPKAPIQEVHVTKEQLLGFEEYLAYIYKIAKDFKEDSAGCNLAADSEKTLGYVRLARGSVHFIGHLNIMPYMMLRII